MRTEKKVLVRLGKKKKKISLPFFWAFSTNTVMGWVALRANNSNGLGLMAQFSFNSRVYKKKKFLKNLTVFFFFLMSMLDFLSIYTIKLKLLTFFDLLRCIQTQTPLLSYQFLFCFEFFLPSFSNSLVTTSLLRFF